MKNKLYKLRIQFPSRAMTLNITKIPVRVKPSRIGRHGNSKTRAYFCPSPKPDVLGGITFEELDTSSLVHELGHAAFEAAKIGVTDGDNLEEQVCQALGLIFEQAEKQTELWN